MSFDLSSSKTVEDLMLAVARKVGLASYGASGRSTATIPDDPDSRAMILAAINDGYKAFLRHDPNWTFLRTTVRLTLTPDGSGSASIAGQPWRYALPQPVRTAPDPGHWRTASDRTPYPAILEIQSDAVERMRLADPSSSGWPQYSACRFASELSESLGTGIDQPRPAWEVSFFPTPIETMVVEAEFRIVPYDLVDLRERHVCGAEHDDTIIKAAMYQWMLSDAPNAGDLERAREAYALALEESVRLDRGQRAARVGTFGDKGVTNTPVHRRNPIVVPDPV
jgi:hypothetical protein